MTHLKSILHLTLLAFAAVAAQAAEFHVATNGADSNPGTKRAPFRTIQRAAERAQPDDTVTVHAGIYRERLNPPRGGTSALLGKAKISNAAYVNPDGSPLKLNTDYFGRKHAGKKPFAGPFAHAMNGRQEIEVWPRGLLAVVGSATAAEDGFPWDGASARQLAGRSIRLRFYIGGSTIYAVTTR